MNRTVQDGHNTIHYYHLTSDTTTPTPTPQNTFKFGTSILIASDVAGTVPSVYRFSNCGPRHYRRTAMNCFIVQRTQRYNRVTLWWFLSHFLMADVMMFSDLPVFAERTVSESQHYDNKTSTGTKSSIAYCLSICLTSSWSYFFHEDGDRSCSRNVV